MLVPGPEAGVYVSVKVPASESQACAMAVPATARANGRMSAPATGYSVESAATTLSSSPFHVSCSMLYSHSGAVHPERVERLEVRAVM